MVRNAVDPEYSHQRSKKKRCAFWASAAAQNGGIVSRLAVTTLVDEAKRNEDVLDRLNEAKSKWYAVHVRKVPSRVADLACPDDERMLGVSQYGVFRSRCVGSVVDDTSSTS